MNNYSQVLVLRLITSSTVEEKILSTAANKMTQEALVIQAGMFHDKYKAHEARELLENVFREKKIKKGKKATKDREISALLARSEQEKKIFLEMDAKNACTIHLLLLSLLLSLLFFIYLFIYIFIYYLYIYLYSLPY
jgi:hypothetical protein